MKNPFNLKDEARDEAYIYFDEKVRPLPKTVSGKIDPFAPGLEGNDVDAFRHAYVSGVFTQEYGRKYGAKTKGRKALLRMIHKALKSGDLIVDPSDERKYKGLHLQLYGRTAAIRAHTRNPLM